MRRRFEDPSRYATDLKYLKSSGFLRGTRSFIWPSSRSRGNGRFSDVKHVVQCIEANICVVFFVLYYYADVMNVSVVDELEIPVKFVGVGEGVEDLQPFEAEAFVNAIFS
ncbi:hypothetical protein E3N88_07914 [Mikania micrantha]|uniref:SRP54-type proteins GTP-binding domain-containing protein n=1 Tax=Mikania micrantha TaxID=192012 RepID=A0A5N6PES4_9ASTR|nr:hypothetical protein E3N88_07914 [Mikania micrantha]